MSLVHAQQAKAGSAKKARRKAAKGKDTEMVPHYGVLACEYHVWIVAGLSLIGQSHIQCSRQNLPSKVLPFVMSSPAFLTCSAPPGKSAACNKMPIAGFPGSSNKVEGILPRVLPGGRTFCQRL